MDKAKINLTDDTLKNILIMAPMLDENGQNCVFGIMYGLLKTTDQQREITRSPDSKTS